MMTRSARRIVSLAFVVCFLLCTVCATVAAVVLAIPAHAADVEPTVESLIVTLPVEGGIAREVNLLEESLVSGAQIQALEIKISQSGTPVAPNDGDSVSVTFDPDIFTLNPQDPMTGTITDVDKGTDKKDTTFTIEIKFTKAASYTPTKDGCTLEYVYTGTDSNKVTQTTEPFHVYTPGGTGTVSISIANIWRGVKSDTSLIGGKMTRGNRYTVDISVTDPEISAADYNKCRTNGNLKANIGSDFFRGTFVPEFSKATEGLQGAANYIVTIPNAEYTGTTDYLALEIQYGAPIDREANANYNASSRCILYERDSSRDDDDDDDSSSSRPDIAPPTPNIIVSKFDYGGGSVRAAGNFTLTVTLTNTSQKLPIDNIVMKVTVPEAFTMNNSSNTFYIERLSRNSSVERTLDLSVKPNAEPISHPIKLAFAFEAVIDEVRKPFTSDEEISIPVTQLDRFSLETVEVPPEVFIGEDMNVEASFVNKGKTTVYNVTAEITGNITQPGQRQFIGNMESGKEESADFLLGALEPGTISGEVIITYEDANMNIGELRSPYTAAVIQMDANPGGDIDVINPEMPPEEPLPWYRQIPVWGYVIGGVVLLIIVTFIAKVIRNRHEQKLLEDDDEDI